MQIVNSTERYTNLTTNRLAAVSTNFGKLVADSATMNNVTVTGLIETVDVMASGIITARGGIGAQSVTIQSNYSIGPSDRGKHFVLENTSGSAIEVRLPLTSDMPPDGDGKYHFTVGPNVLDRINISANGGDLIYGLVTEGAGTSTHFEGTSQLTVDPSFSVHGDTMIFRAVPKYSAHYVHGSAKNPGAIV